MNGAADFYNLKFLNSLNSETKLTLIRAICRLAKFHNSTWNTLFDIYRLTTCITNPNGTIGLEENQGMLPEHEYEHIHITNMPASANLKIVRLLRALKKAKNMDEAKEAQHKFSGRNRPLRDSEILTEQELEMVQAMML